MPRTTAAAAPLRRELGGERRTLARERESRREGSAARLPRSLRGTEADGALAVAPDGHFLATPDAVALFEYYLTASGEEPWEDLVARIVAAIDERLTAPANAEAHAFLERYLTYRERAADLDDTAPTADLEAGFERLRALRREVFGTADAERLFGEDEAVARVALAQRRVAADPSLTDEQRHARIEQLSADLPESVRTAREAALAPLRLMEEERVLATAGASAEQLRHVREQRFGKEAADRLEALDRERAAWQARVDDYRAERAAIEADSTLGEATKGAAIERLLEERFDARERLRVQALDRIAEQGPPR